MYKKEFLKSIRRLKRELNEFEDKDNFIKQILFGIKKHFISIIIKKVDNELFKGSSDFGIYMNQAYEDSFDLLKKTLEIEFLKCEADKQCFVESFLNFHTNKMLFELNKIIDQTLVLYKKILNYEDIIYSFRKRIDKKVQEDYQIHMEIEDSEIKIINQEYNGKKTNLKYLVEILEKEEFSVFEQIINILVSVYPKKCILSTDMSEFDLNSILMICKDVFQDTIAIELKKLSRV